MRRGSLAGQYGSRPLGGQGDELTHLIVLGLDIDRQIELAQGFAGSRSDRSDGHPLERFARPLRQPQILGHAQQVDHLMARREKGHLALAGRDRPQIVGQRRDVFGKLPAINADRLDPGTAGFEPGDQTGVRPAIFQQSDVLLSHGHAHVDRGQHFTPGIGLGHADSRLQAKFLEHRDGFWPARNGGHVRQGGQEAWSIDVALDFGNQVANADAGHEDNDVDLAGDHAIGKVDGRPVFGDRHLAH